MKHPMAVERVEDCPDPSYHDTFRYCPYCPWTDPDAPKSDAEVWRARAEAAEAERDALAARVEEALDLADRATLAWLDWSYWGLGAASANANALHGYETARVTETQLAALRSLISPETPNG